VWVYFYFPCCMHTLSFSDQKTLIFQILEKYRHYLTLLESLPHSFYFLKTSYSTHVGVSQPPRLFTSLIFSSLFLFILGNNFSSSFHFSMPLVVLA
jgi:hypothetical protein